MAKFYIDMYKNVFKKIASEVLKYNTNEANLNVIANYVHKTWLNDILLVKYI